MCLIPRAVIEEIGLSLPLFIKWDDAEYGVRASAAGFPTVSMPGVGVWHVPWTDKNDALDWQAYFHQRNRTVRALLHSPYAFGGRMVRESFNHQVKHLLAMQYSTAELRLLAIEDVLRGPSTCIRRSAPGSPTCAPSGPAIPTRRPSRTATASRRCGWPSRLDAGAATRASGRRS
jgi:GT2 family glycosyltransferase